MKRSAFIFDERLFSTRLMASGLRRYQPRAHGFTLIELLVVVAIIAVLVAILLPALQSARDSAKMAVCLSKQQQIGVAVMGYAAANHGYIVPASFDARGELPGAKPLWYDLLASESYLSYSSRLLSGGSFVGPPTQDHVLHCPADERDVGHCSYSVSLYVCGYVAPPPFSPYSELWKIRSIDSFTRSPSAVVLAGERGNLDGYPMGSYYSPVTVRASWWSGYNGNGAGFDWARHSRGLTITEGGVQGGRGNLLLADGHVQSYNDVDFPSYVAGTDICYSPPSGSQYPTFFPNE